MQKKRNSCFIFFWLIQSANKSWSSKIFISMVYLRRLLLHLFWEYSFWSVEIKFTFMIYCMCHKYPRPIKLLDLITQRCHFSLTVYFCILKNIAGIYHMQIDCILVIRKFFWTPKNHLPPKATYCRDLNNLIKQKSWLFFS